MPRANYISGVNPEILKWAREKSGYSLDEVARSFGKDAQYVEGWESGNVPLTYVQLERLAYQLYKRPIAIFFFPEPPKEDDPKQSFRTLPDVEISNLLPDTRHAIREAKVMQYSLQELYEGQNDSKRKIFLDIVINKNQNIVESTNIVRGYLGVSLDEQMRWRSKDEALKKWREIIQDNGVFIFKRPFKETGISGFCLVDNEFPIIYLNSSTTFGRQIFTIFHELAHILLKTSGITKRNDDYIDALLGDAREIEVFCNQFAAEFLVPTSDLASRTIVGEPVDELAQRFSDVYNVSREVILRKYLDTGLIEREHYNLVLNEWHEEYKEYKKGRGGGGSYYLNHRTYLGDKYIAKAFNCYYRGRCSIEQLADYLSVKPKNIGNFEQVVMGNVTA